MSHWEINNIIPSWSPCWEPPLYFQCPEITWQINLLKPLSPSIILLSKTIIFLMKSIQITRKYLVSDGLKTFSYVWRKGYYGVLSKDFLISSCALFKPPPPTHGSPQVSQHALPASFCSVSFVWLKHKGLPGKTIIKISKSHIPLIVTIRFILPNLQPSASL